MFTIKITKVRADRKNLILYPPKFWKIPKSVHLALAVLGTILFFALFVHKL